MLPGDVLEELALYVADYNKALLAEKDAELAKKLASGSILSLLKQHQCREIEAGGCRLTIKAWTRESVDMARAKMLFSPELLAQATKVSGGLSLDVRPLRGQ